MPTKSSKTPRPVTPPDTAQVYERAKPEFEPGQGDLKGNPDATPAKQADRTAESVANRQGARQINAEDVTDSRGVAEPGKNAREAEDDEVDEVDRNGPVQPPARDAPKPKSSPTHHPARTGRGGVV